MLQYPLPKQSWQPADVFVIMISKSQELFDHVGIYLLELVFWHDNFTLH